VTPTPDVARAEELIEAVENAIVETERCKRCWAGTCGSDHGLPSDRSALLSFVRDLARERDSARLKHKEDAAQTVDLLHGLDEARASLSRVRGETLEEAAKVLDAAGFTHTKPLDPPATPEEICRAFRLVADHLAKRIRSLASSAPGDPPDRSWAKTGHAFGADALAAPAEPARDDGGDRRCGDPKCKGGCGCTQTGICRCPPAPGSSSSAGPAGPATTATGARIAAGNCPCGGQLVRFKDARTPQAQCLKCKAWRWPAPSPGAQGEEAK
jgi:hypothetical protein